jgi:hypothetical protein
MMFMYILVFVAIRIFLKKNVTKLQPNCLRIFLKFSTIPILIWICKGCLNYIFKKLILTYEVPIKTFFKCFHFIHEKTNNFF